MIEPRESLLDAGVLRRLIRRLEATDVDELEVVHGTTRLFLRRDPGRPTGLAAAPRSDSATEAPGIAVTAPLTGVLYTRPSPEAEPYVVTGMLAEIGQVVALIETMKLFNEVTLEVAGEVVAITAEEGALVEAGQPLMYVRPLAESEEL